MPLHKGQMPAPQRVQWQLHVSALKCKPSANCVCTVPLNWWAGLFSMRLLFASHGLIPSCSAGDVRTIPGVGCWWRRQRRCRPVWRCSPSRDQRHFVGSRGPLPPPSSASLLHQLLRQTFKGHIYQYREVLYTPHDIHRSGGEEKDPTFADWVLAYFSWQLKSRVWPSLSYQHQALCQSPHSI